MARDYANDASERAARCQWMQHERARVFSELERAAHWRCATSFVALGKFSRARRDRRCGRKFRCVVCGFWLRARCAASITLTLRLCATRVRDLLERTVGLLSVRAKGCARSGDGDARIDAARAEPMRVGMRAMQGRERRARFVCTRERRCLWGEMDCEDAQASRCGRIAAEAAETRGARSRTRTGTAARPADFKSAASTDFAIRAGCGDRASLADPPARSAAAVPPPRAATACDAATGFSRPRRRSPRSCRARGIRSTGPGRPGSAPGTRRLRGRHNGSTCARSRVRPGAGRGRDR